MATKRAKYSSKWNLAVSLRFTLVLFFILSALVVPENTGMAASDQPITRSSSAVVENKIDSETHFASSTDGKIWYVDNTNPSCSDLGAGSSEDLPFCTIGKAASLAVAGHTIHVLAGTYAETVRPGSGSATNPLTFTASPGVTVTGAPGNPTVGGAFRLSSKSYVIIDGFNVTGTEDYGIYVYNSQHITIANNHISYSGTPESGSTRMGIYLQLTTDSLVDRNTSDHNSSDGIRLVSSSNNTVSNNRTYENSAETVRVAAGIFLTNGSNDNIIIHNITYSNEDSGINLYAGSSNNTIVGNVSFGNGDHGIDCNSSPNNNIVGNTVQGNVTAGINLEGDAEPGSGGATIMNNILADNGLRLLIGGGTTTDGFPGNLRIDRFSQTKTKLDYNLYYLDTHNLGIVQIIFGSTIYYSLSDFKAAVTGQEANGLADDPLFKNPATPAERPTAAPFTIAQKTGDYHLTAGSPAIDSANADAPGEPDLDMDGFPRWDEPNVANTGAGVRLFDDRGAYEFLIRNNIYAPLIFG